MLSRSSTSDTPLVIHLSSISAYSTFGELLRTLRNHHNTTFHGDLSPQTITDAANQLLKKTKGVRELGKRAYADLESGRRYPRFIELEPIFRALVETCYVEFTDLEITAYLHLARVKIGQNQKPKQSEKVEEADWETLEATLFRIHQSKLGRVRLVTEAQAQSELSALTEDPHSRRLRAIKKAIDTDIRHLLEREEWVTKMLTYPEKNPQVKLVVVQGAIGVGKSHAQALLIRRLAAQSPDYYLIPYLFQPGEGKTPEDHLDEFLATVTADLTLTPDVSGETKQQSLTDRIQQVLTALKSRKEKVIFLLDDVHYIFPTAGEWLSSWLEFMEAFVREPHNATCYLFTRTWPGWDERRDAYIEPTELLDLSPTASVSLWQRRCFDDVPETLLQEVCARCGHNPQMMDMLMAQCKKVSFARNRWGQSGALSPQSEKKSVNTQRLEALLAQDTMFDLKMDVKSRAVLQQVLTSRLNHQARQMLECLSLSPLGLPFSLLLEEFANAEVALNELVSVSAVDLNMAAAQRAAIIPFVREAVLLALISDGRMAGIETRVTDLYAHWLNDVQDFRDDAEKAALIAEMVVRYVRSRRLLDAAELLLSYWWLCALFRHTSRIQRVFDEMVRQSRGKVEEPKHEVGRLLLQHRIAVMKGQNIVRDERDDMYQNIDKKVISGEVQLKHYAELEVLHNMLLLYNRRGQFREADTLFDKTLERLKRSGQITPEISATFLSEKALLMVYQADAAEKPEESLRFTQASVDFTRETIANWQLCLKNALPLQEKHVQFKLGRALNDLACDLRALKQYPEAQKAIERSIQLKKESGTLPHSVGVAQSEYSQILAAQGKIREALAVSEEARRTLEYSLESGSDVHKPELGLVLKERATILLLQARLSEARPLLEQAVDLIGNKPLRQKDKNESVRKSSRFSTLLDHTSSIVVGSLAFSTS